MGRIERVVRRGRHDAAMNEVAHDAVARRPVIRLAGEVVGAALAGAERGLRAQHAQAHRRAPRRVIGLSIVLLSATGFVIEMCGRASAVTRGR